MTEYSIQEVPKKLGEILEKIRTGQKIVLTEAGEDVAEIRPLKRISKGDSVEEVFQELEERGIISGSREPRGELAPVAVRPGALERFLASRD